MAVVWTHRVGAALACAAALLPAGLSGQGGMWAAGCRPAVVTHDSLVQVAYLTLGLVDGAPGAKRRGASTQAMLDDARRTLALALQEIAAHFHAPPYLGLEYGATMSFGTHATADGRAFLVPILGARVAFTLLPDGRTRDVAVERHSAAPVLDSLLADAVAQSDADGSLAWLDLGRAIFGASDHVRLRLAIGWSADSSTIGVPVARIHVPVYAGTSISFSDENRLPSYPSAAAERGDGGQVVAEFDIDPLGRVLPESIEVTGDPNAELRDATVSAVREWHFIPATLGGCPVRVHVRQTFRYLVER